MLGYIFQYLHVQSIRIQSRCAKGEPRENDDDKMYSCKKCDGKMCPLLQSI